MGNLDIAAVLSQGVRRNAADDRDGSLRHSYAQYRTIRPPTTVAAGSASYLRTRLSGLRHTGVRHPSSTLPGTVSAYAHCLLR